MAKSKKWIHTKKAKTSRAKNFSQLDILLTINARIVFIKLTQAFVEAPILNYFDLKRYIRIETDTLGYAIGRILSQLILDNLGQ